MNQLSPAPSLRSPLQSAICRDFGSIADFRRNFYHACRRSSISDDLWLVVTRYDQLQLVLSPQAHTPQGCPLFHVPLHEPHPSALSAQQQVLRHWQTIDWNEAEMRYKDFRTCRPRYPAG